MASKKLTHDELKAIVAAKMDDPNTTASDILSTILGALREPTEGMNVAGCQADDPLGALVDWRGENCTPREGVANVWRAMLAASALGEQSE